MQGLPQFLQDLDEEYRDALGQEDAGDLELFVAQHTAVALIVSGKCPEQQGVCLSSDGRWHQYAHV